MAFVWASLNHVMTKLKPGSSTKRGNASFKNPQSSKPVKRRQKIGKLKHSQFATKMKLKNAELKQMQATKLGTQCVKRRRSQRRKVALQIQNYLNRCT
jgi:hypothetical protein